MEEAALTKTIIACAMRVHSALGPGFLESVYQKALVHEIAKAGLQSDTGCALTVRYDGVIVGEFIADLIVENLVLVELKASLALVAAHEVQLVNYLTATGIEIGLLVNFGAERLQFKRKTRIYRPKSSLSDAFL